MPELPKQLAQIGHGDLVARPKVDPAQQRNVGRHGHMVGE